MSETPDLFVFGMGYSAGHYARTRAPAHERVWASVRSREKRDRLRAQTHRRSACRNAPA